MVRGENPQETLALSEVRRTTAVFSFVEDAGRVCTGLRTPETEWWGLGSEASQRASQAGVAPLRGP